MFIKSYLLTQWLNHVFVNITDWNLDDEIATIFLRPTNGLIKYVVVKILANMNCTFPSRY